MPWALYMFNLSNNSRPAHLCLLAPLRGSIQMSLQYKSGVTPVSVKSGSDPQCTVKCILYCFPCRRWCGSWVIGPWTALPLWTYNSGSGVTWLQKGELRTASKDGASWALWGRALLDPFAAFRIHTHTVPHIIQYLPSSQRDQMRFSCCSFF